MRIILTFILLHSFSLGNAQSKLSPKELTQDFDYMIKELRLQHQGLYNYVEKEQTDSKLDSVRKTLNVPLHKLDFYKKLRYTIGLTNEAHTSIKLSKWAMRRLGFSKSFIPLAVKYCDGSLIITQYYGKNITGLKKGSRIIAVNGQKVDEILDQIYPLIPTDGFNQTSKNEWIGGLNFSFLYRLVYGKTKSVEIKVQEWNHDRVQSITIPCVSLRKFKNKNAKFKPKYFDYTRFKFAPINDSIAYLSIPSFGNDDLNYEDFYKKSFKRIDSLDIKHLIIDIQANGGGTEGNENLLFSYLSNKVVKKYRQVTMRPKPYQKNKHKSAYIEDKWTFSEAVAKRGEFTLYSDYYSDLGYKKPNKELIYQGKLYVLISGRTFSGGAEFASLVKMTNRGIFIGEEVGGAYEGNVSGYSEYIKLPHSKLEVKIPTVHFQINVSPDRKGHGVVPDYIVPQTWADYIAGNNAKKEFSISLITK